MKKIYINIDMPDEKGIYEPQDNTQITITDESIIDEVYKIYSHTDMWGASGSIIEINNEEIEVEDRCCSVTEFIEAFKNTQTLEYIQKHIDLQSYKNKVNELENMVNIAFPLPKITNVEVYISIVEDTFKEDGYNIPIYTPLTNNSYKIPDTKDRAKELIRLCKSNYNLGGSAGFVCGFVNYENISFQYDDFIKAFSDYSDFKALCETIKIDNYKDKQELITIDFNIKSSLL